MKLFKKTYSVDTIAFALFVGTVIFVSLFFVIYAIAYIDRHTLPVNVMTP